jgi:hypothetical protein
LLYLGNDELYASQRPVDRAATNPQQASSNPTETETWVSA